MHGLESQEASKGKGDNSERVPQYPGALTVVVYCQFNHTGTKRRQWRYRYTSSRHSRRRLWYPKFKTDWAALKGDWKWEEVHATIRRKKVLSRFPGRKLYCKWSGNSYLTKVLWPVTVYLLWFSCSYVWWPWVGPLVWLPLLQKQHARLSEAPRQTEEEEWGAGVRLSVQLALGSQPGPSELPAAAEVGLWQTQSVIALDRHPQIGSSLFDLKSNDRYQFVLG